MNYHLLEEEVNPGVGFNEDEFVLKMPFLEQVEDERFQLGKVELYFLRKQEILDYFTDLFDFLEEDFKETGELFECYDSEDEEKYLTYSIFVIPEENKFELAITYASQIGMSPFSIYTADFHANDSKGELLDEVIEGSHTLFHEELMKIAENYKGILNKK